MSIANYSDLQSEVATWLARSDLSSAVIQDCISLFEARVKREMRVRAMINTSTTTTDASATDPSLIALPSDFLEMINLRIDASPNVELHYMTVQQMDDTFVGSTSAQPTSFTILGSNIRLAPSPDGTYTLRLNYYSFSPLSSSNTTNWLITNHPDAYLFGSLVEARAFVNDLQKLPLWQQRLEQAWQSVMLAERRSKYGGTLQIKTDTGNP